MIRQIEEKKEWTKAILEDNKMNDNLDTMYDGNYVWNKEANGTYTKTLSIYYKNGRTDNHIMETGISEKEYFRRKLDGTA